MVFNVCGECSHNSVALTPSMPQFREELQHAIMQLSTGKLKKATMPRPRSNLCCCGVVVVRGVGAWRCGGGDRCEHGWSIMRNDRASRE